MKTHLLLATAMGFALMLTVAPTFAASSHPATNHPATEHHERSEQTGSTGGFTCADILADQSEHSPADVRSCKGQI